MTTRVMVHLQPLSDSQGRPEVGVSVPEGATVRHVMEHLCYQYPELAVHILENSGGITEYLIVFVNGQQVSDLDSVIDEHDEVLIIFPVGGG
jgi:molybdopterin converting factor small subunit